MNRTILALAAAGGLVLSPFTAQAGTATPAVIATTSPVAVTADRSSSPGAGQVDQKVATSLAVAVVIAAGAATYGRVKAFRGTKLARAD